MHVSLCGGRVSTLNTKSLHVEAFAHSPRRVLDRRMPLWTQPTVRDVPFWSVQSHAWLESHEWLVLCCLGNLSLRLILFCGLDWRVWCGSYPGEGVPGSEGCKTCVIESWWESGMNKHIECGPISDESTPGCATGSVFTRLRQAVKPVKLCRYKTRLRHKNCSEMLCCGRL